MLLRQLSSVWSSICPRGHPALYHAGFRSSITSSWWSIQGFPPWPPRLLHSLPSAHQIFTLHPLNISPGHISSCSCSFHTSEGHMMERSDQDREPPNKRQKGGGEREGHRGGPPKATGGKESKREHHHLDFRKEGGLRPNHHFKDETQDRAKYYADKAVSWESSRDKDVERTKTGKAWYRKDDRERNPNQHSHPAGSRTQIPKFKPEMDPVSEHKPKHWFKGRGAEEQSRFQRNTTGPPEQPKDSGKWTGPPSKASSPSRPSHHLNPWQVVEQPPPPGILLPCKPLQRHWETCHSGPHPPRYSAVFDFSVMSYNILSQELLQDNAYLYRHCDPSILHWEYRLPNLLAEIQQHDADILCLQEVQMDHYENQIKPALQALGYHCELKKRTGSKPDGCAVIFKTSRFSLLSTNPVEFFRHGDALLDRDNVGLVVLLQPRNSISQSDPSSFICVANTHLLYNPRRGDVKLAQLAILLAEINRLSRLPDGSTNPVVLCGDFNSVPCSPLYSFMTTGCLEYEGLQISMVSGQETSPRGQRFLTSPIWSHSLGINHQCQYESKLRADPSPSSPTAVEGGISNLSVEDPATAAASNSVRLEHSLKLQSSYQHHLVPDGRPEITTCHSRTALTVDYILYSPDFNTTSSLPGGRGLQLLGRLSLVGESELEEVRGLPNQHHSSDHLPLLVSFRLRH
ncbi:protein angel homolog 2 isoform X2 [Melanotaenia boesemani]|uniref:protein angel homolog 2 isoform X2 n=1 Tax=Melanotaenia boesemani TaxID=1250792 RepID=UPI001C04558D|nr:protein angel homolog 2 isoform X2 [Melanotaenia boesemani]